MPASPEHPLTLRSIAIVGITLLALAWGGSTQLWAEACIVLAAAILILIYPPRRDLGLTPNCTVLAFFALALTAFLPALLVPMADWRRQLEDLLQTSLSPFLTPQPWLTIQQCGILFFVLIWIYYLFAQDWSPAEKSGALRLFVAGVIVLSTLAIVCFVTGWRIPGWNEQENRGWFPNRNQTADVLALSGVAAYTLAFRQIQQRKWSGAFWLAGLGLIGAALIISYSRAGILFFFGGVCFWHLLILVRKGQARVFALGISAFLILLSLFFLFGGSTLERFSGVASSSPSPEARTDLFDYRARLQEDAFFVSLKSPILGVGLGNFEPVFTAQRDKSADQNRAIHPESDWLWMIVEMGWLSPLLILIGIRWWITESLPFSQRSGEGTRQAAFVAFILFLLHGFVDVPGHRLGSVSVGLLMAALALSPNRKIRVRPWIASLFRCLALVLIMFAAWWIASSTSDFGPPTTARLIRIQADLEQAAGAGRLASVSGAANEALDIAPLNWTLYFRRACAEAFRTGGTAQADIDFKAARFLEPHWIGLCINEGQVWQQAGNEKKAIAAWREALNRAGLKDSAPYRSILALTANDPEAHNGLRKAARSSPEYFVTFLAFANPDEVREEIDWKLYVDPGLQSLSSDQRARLFALWYERGDQAKLALGLHDHPDWLAASWHYLAQYYASRGDFYMAAQTALRFLPPPTIPGVPAEKPLPLLESHFEQHNDDLVEGLMLAQAEIQASHPDRALDLLSHLEQMPRPPSAVFYLKGQVYMQQQDWEKAWNAFARAHDSL